MKFFISVDMEGISGIVDGSMVSRKQGDYEGGRKLMTADTNAAIKGTLSAHPDTETTVRDAHGSMNNIDPAVSKILLPIEFFAFTKNWSRDETW